MNQPPLNIAIVGCGNIAGRYGKTLLPHPELKLLGATSRTLKRAEDFVATFGGKVYPSLEAILADDEVDLVINLTIHQAHVDVITQCLNAGKHVYSEKPIALTSEEAWKLVALAGEKGLRFGCAPNRVTRAGVPFHVTTPDFSIAAIEFASGAVARLTANFYVGFHSKQKGIEFHGDEGSLYLSNWHDFHGAVEYTDFTALPPASDAYKPLPYVKAPYSGKTGEPGSNVEWSRGVLDMAGAMKENRPQRITAVQAAHVVDVVCGIQEASRAGRRVEITSEFQQPTPMEWAR